MSGTGYAVELERKDLIRAASWPFPDMSSFYANREIDPRSWYKIRNQGSQGSCRGHSLAGCARFCATLQAGMLDLDDDGRTNEYLQDDFSPQYCYIRTQQFDGIRGDRGSTISGGINTGKEGIAREIKWPYPGRYVSRIPNEATEDAQQFRLARVTEIRNERQAWDWMQSGQGALDIGMVWAPPLKAGCVCVGLPRRTQGGGHAMAILGCITGQTLKRDVRNAPVADHDWLYVSANSWGANWGDRGWWYITRNAMAEIIEHAYTALIGWSDMEGVQVRTIDWADALSTH